MATKYLEKSGAIEGKRFSLAKIDLQIVKNGSSPEQASFTVVHHLIARTDTAA
jgi:hypothetical protein